MRADIVGRTIRMQSTSVGQSQTDSEYANADHASHTVPLLKTLNQYRESLTSESGSKRQVERFQLNHEHILLKSRTLPTLRVIDSRYVRRTGPQTQAIGCDLWQVAHSFGNRKGRATLSSSTAS